MLSSSTACAGAAGLSVRDEVFGIQLSLSVMCTPSYFVFLTDSTEWGEIRMVPPEVNNDLFSFFCFFLQIFGVALVR